MLNCVLSVSKVHVGDRKVQLFCGDTETVVELSPKVKKKKTDKVKKCT